MQYDEVKTAPWSSLWQPTVLPADIHHVLISPVGGGGLDLAELALAMALPTLAEVTLCCPPDSGSEAGQAAETAEWLRSKGLRVYMDRGAASELDSMFRVDMQRSVDLVLMHEHEPAGRRGWRATNALEVVRRLLRPVVACGPFYAGGAADSRGPVVAAVSMRESSEQIVQAAGRIGSLMHHPVNIVHAVDIAHDYSRPDNLTAVACECQLLGNWIAGVEAAASAKVLCGPVAEMVLQFAGKADAALLVAGVDLEEEGREAQNSDGLRRELLMRANCPVLFVPTFHGSRQRRAHAETAAAEAWHQPSMPRAV